MRTPHCVTLLGLCLFAWPGMARGADTEAIVQQNEDAVVIIFGEKTGRDQRTQSSGCCVATAGLILTTAHQVEGVQGLRARLKDGSGRYLSVLAVDRSVEVALLKADRPLPRAARIGNAHSLKSGSALVAIAAPKSLDFSVTTGNVSSLNRTYKGHPVIQAILPAAPGSSGGPVFDKDGALVGLIIGKLEEEEWVKLVNPVNNAYALLRRSGIAVPEREYVDPVEAEISPVPEASPTEREAIRAYNRGVAAASPSEKIDAYNVAVKLLPGFYEAWFNLAVAYSARGDVAPAIEAYRTAEALRPDAVAVQRNLGRILLKEKRGDEVVACFERAVQLAPEDPSSYNDLGEAYRQAKQLEKAESTLLKALKLRPDYAAARYNLGLTYVEIGRPAEAKAQFLSYLDLDPDAPDADQVRAWMAELPADSVE